jgi:hypothetical protein
MTASCPSVASRSRAAAIDHAHRWSGSACGLAAIIVERVGTAAVSAAVV